MSAIPVTGLEAVPSMAKPIPGPKVLLMGVAGTGKTYSLGTLADWASTHSKTMFALFTDTSADTLLGYWRDRGLEVPECLHWHTQLVRPLDLTSIMDAADKVGRYSYELITKMVDNNREKNNAFWQILAACHKPVSDRDGREFPPVDSWGPNMIFAIDGMTELSNAAMKMQIGNKPTAAPPDYGVAQNNLMNFLRLCAQGSQYTFVLIAHPSLEKNELTGITMQRVSTVGTAICSQIPPMFSDVIYTVREGNEFTWDTSAYGVETKTRSLGYRSKIKPDFGQIMDMWLIRGGK